MSRLPLRVKIGLSVLLILGLFVVSTGLVARQILHAKLKAMVTESQDAHASRMAEDLDARLQLMLRALVATASTATGRDLANPDAAQRFLDANQGTLSVFDRSIFLFAPDGRLIAENPFRPKRRGENFAYRSYISETLRTKKPFISEPFITTKTDHHVVLMFAAPILDARGEAAAIMAGSVGVTDPNVLGSLATLRIGRTGYATLTTAEGIAIIHPEHQRLMQPAAEAGQNPLFDRAMQGWSGTDETTNSRGTPVLSSFKRVPSTNWILGVHFPQAEAYAPAHETFLPWMIAVLVTGAILFLGVWLVVGRLVRPISQFTEDLRQLAVSGRRPDEVRLQGDSKEIVELGAAFNRLLRILREQEATLADAADQYKLLADNSTDLITRYDRDGICLYASPSSTTLSGFKPEELQGRPLTTFVHPENLRAVENALLEARSGTGTSTVQYMMLARERGHIWVETALRRFDHHDGGLVCATRNIGARKQMEDSLRHLASHDSLTQLPNRTMLLDQLALAIEAASARRGRIALVLLDLDRFKNVNDTLGHDVGDELLQAASLRIEDCGRRSEVTARLGGDEFVILMRSIASRRDPQALAQRLLTSLSQPFKVAGQTVHVGASIGIAIYPEDSADAHELIKHADMAMYAVKNAGGNNFRYYDAQMADEAAARLQVESALHKALECDELALHYQPIVGVDGRVVGAEALLRWQHPQSGLRVPADFMDPAETSGLIVPIGGWVIARALHDARTWRENGLPLRVSVNVSSRQFAQDDLLELILRCLEREHLRGEALEIEIVESALLDDPERGSAVLRELRRHGVKIALDDFGTGYSNFAYLRNLPVDKLKIDRQFVNDMASTDNGTAIVGSMVELGAKLGLELTAEGVETLEQVNALKALGCTLFQGHYFGVPMSTTEFLALAKNLNGPADQRRDRKEFRLAGAG